MKIHCKFDKMVDPKTLKHHPKNRNKHDKEQIDRLAKILEYQGWRYAIKVSNQSKCITSGHGRAMTAIKMGLKQVPVVYQDYQDSTQEYADVQSDNAIAAWADLDLSGINEDLKGLGIKFDKDLLGLKSFLLGDKEEFLAEELWNEDFEGRLDQFKVAIVVENEAAQKKILKLLDIKNPKKYASGKLISCHWPEIQDD